MQNVSWASSWVWGSELAAVLPEIVLAVAILGLLVVGVMRRGDAYHSVLIGAMAALAGVGIIYAMRAGTTIEAFDGLYQQGNISLYTKFLVLTSAAGCLLMARPHLAAAKADKFEFPILVLTSVLGMLIALSSGDFISLYVGIELQSLSLYILAAFTRDRREAAEAGLKYFLLGSLSSGLLLFGISILYGLTGSTNFVHIAQQLGAHSDSMPAMLALVFILAGLAFKTSAAPFHMWTPDVYQGAPTPVTAFFSLVPKTSDLTVMLLVLSVPLAPLVNQWQQMLLAAALLSMAVGSFTALLQPFTKRLLAYSAINHVGFMLLGIAVHTPEGQASMLVYLVTYLLTGLGSFGLLLLAEQQGERIEKLADLAGLAQRRPRIALGLAAMLFSMAGIPPFAGFFGKLLIFQALLHAGWVWIATLAVFFSVVAIFYYLRIIKIMYFDPAIHDAPDVSSSPAPSMPLVLMATLGSIATLTFIIWADWVISSAQMAVDMLVGK